MRRRDALSTIAWVTAQELFPRGGTAAGPRPTVGRKALVVGAGMAGIAAARGLKSHGFEVVVLEGRKRMGGRIWTDRSLGRAVDLGAAWIEEASRNPLAKLARQWDLTLKPTHHESLALYDRDGSRWEQRDVKTILDDRDELLSDAQALVDELPADTSLAEGIRRELAGEPLTAEDRRAYDWALATQVCEYGAELDELSLRHFDEDLAAGWEDLLVVDGYDRLVERLAEGLDVRLGREVTRIEHGNRGVRVSTASETFSADFAVVTLPLGVLKAGRVRFTPDLPDEKRAAIDRLGMGLVNKVALRYPSRFWPAEPDFLGSLSAGGVEFPQFVNLTAPAGVPIVVAVAAGRRARASEKLAQRDVGRAAHAVLRTMFGRKIPEPARFLVTRWGADPFALGAYSHVPVGVSGEEYERLAQPVGERLLFAGEATSRRFPSTVHGAYLSGLREAERAARML
ncbi:MAG TPA: FAD-dependent oxidoreductase [Pirellulales bacterium]|nr:FAD-dependent oxidoreductase [Pirellulales bacterium]